MPDSPWLTAAEAAHRARVGVKTIYRETRAGKLRGARVGGRRELRYLPDWVDSWLESTATPVLIEMPRHEREDLSHHRRDRLGRHPTTQRDGTRGVATVAQAPDRRTPPVLEASTATTAGPPKTFWGLKHVRPIPRTTGPGENEG